MKYTYSVFLMFLIIIFFSCNNNENKNISVIDLKITPLENQPLMIYFRGGFFFWARFCVF
jgi:hypothetical protein